MIPARTTDGLLANEPVDGLAKEVGVSVVPRVLLDHVHQDPAQLRRGAVPGVAPHGEPVETTVGQCLGDEVRERATASSHEQFSHGVLFSGAARLRIRKGRR